MELNRASERPNSIGRLITRAMLVRSLVAAFVVGGILFVANHDGFALMHPWTLKMWKNFAFSLAVPFVVSLTSAVLTRRDLLAARQTEPPQSPESP